MTLDLEERRNYLGASECAAVLGLSPYQSPMDVWLSKTGKVMKVQSDNDSMYWGRTLEPIVAQEFAKRHNLELTDPQKEIRYEHGPIRSHLDFWIEQWKCPLEIKTTSAFTEPWIRGVPTPYYIQCQIQMFLTGSKSAYIACLKGGNSYSEHHVQLLPQKDIEKLFETLCNWWTTYVEKQQQPPVTTLKEINNLFPESKPGAVKILTHDNNGEAVEEAIKNIAMLKADHKEAEEGLETNEAIVKSYMGDSETLVGHDGEPIATWKSVRRRSKVDWAECIEHELGAQFLQEFKERNEYTPKSYRVFKIKA